MDLILGNKDELVKGVDVGDSLGRSDHEMVEVRILGGGSRAWSQLHLLSPPVASPQVMGRGAQMGQGGREEVGQAPWLPTSLTTKH